MFGVLGLNNFDIGSALSNFMEQKLRFGLVLGLVDSTEKNWADYEQLMRAFFHVFMCEKKNCSVCAKKLHKLKVNFF